MINKPKKIWVITDTHFNHPGIIEMGRPEDYQEQILYNWRVVVDDNDLVIHLGDVIFNRQTELKGIMDSLPGTKILVRGNHDHRPSWYLNRGFTWACDAMEYRGVYFTHIPSRHLPPGCEVNIHGHLHTGNHRLDEIAKRPWHIKLSLEEVGYRPILLEEAKELQW